MLNRGKMYKHLKGKRVELISMEGDEAPVAPGEKGTVEIVDDIGTLHVKWDNGRSLGLVPGVDRYKVLD
jgi:hypothetical protein